MDAISLRLIKEIIRGLDLWLWLASSPPRSPSKVCEKECGLVPRLPWGRAQLLWG